MPLCWNHIANVLFVIPHPGDQCGHQKDDAMQRSKAGNELFLLVLLLLFLQLNFCFFLFKIQPDEIVQAHINVGDPDQ